MCDVLNSKGSAERSLRSVCFSGYTRSGGGGQLAVFLSHLAQNMQKLHYIRVMLQARFHKLLICNFFLYGMLVHKLKHTS